MIYGDMESSSVSNREQEISESVKRQQIIQSHIDEIYLTCAMTTEEKSVEETRWRFGQLTDGEKQLLEIEVKGNHVPSPNAMVQSSNLYVYVMNNSMNYIDPYGTFSVRKDSNASIIINLSSYDIQSISSTGDFFTTLGELAGASAPLIVGVVGNLIASGLSSKDRGRGVDIVFYLVPSTPFYFLIPSIYSV